MTLDDMKAMTREFLTPKEVAAVLGADPQDIRVTAKQAPEKLGFNLAVVGTRVKIPRIGFIRWMEGGR